MEVLVKLVKVLFTRRGNENATTRMYPVAGYVEGAVDEAETGTFCAGADFDMPVAANLYEVREVELPEFLDGDEYADDSTNWAYNWGQGVQKTWKESWQRGLLGFSSAETLGCVKLLKVKKFRSEFRKSLREQLEAWLDTPTEERTHGSPFSSRQWDCLVDFRTEREAKYTDDRIYWR